jgi:hypothetical protein
MNIDDKNYLLERLTETHAALKGIVDGVDLTISVYTDPDWQIKDVLGHIATWDREVAKSLRAFMAETEYLTLDLDDEETEFNQQAVLEHRKLSTQQLVEEWEQARSDFKNALNEIPLNQFPGDLVYPWGEESGSIGNLVKYMVDHTSEHLEEIMAAINASTEN